MKAVKAMNYALSAGESHALREKALELAGDDHVTARLLLEMIVETNRTTLATLRDSFESACWDSVASAAHRIAGSARMLECDELIAWLTQLEAAMRERDITRAAALLPRVVNALGELDVSIETALRNVG